MCSADSYRSRLQTCLPEGHTGENQIRGNQSKSVIFFLHTRILHSPSEKMTPAMSSEPVLVRSLQTRNTAEFSPRFVGVFVVISVAKRAFDFIITLAKGNENTSLEQKGTWHVFIAWTPCRSKKMFGFVFTEACFKLCKRICS